MWEVMVQTAGLVVERQRNDRGWIVRAYFLRDNAMDLAFIPDNEHRWVVDEPETMDEGGFFKSRLWKTPTGWLHLTVREVPASLALTYMPN